MLLTRQYKPSDVNITNLIGSIHSLLQRRKTDEEIKAFLRAHGMPVYHESAFALAVDRMPWDTEEKAARIKAYYKNRKTES